MTNLAPVKHRRIPSQDLSEADETRGERSFCLRGHVPCDSKTDRGRREFLLDPGTRHQKRSRELVAESLFGIETNFPAMGYEVAIGLGQDQVRKLVSKSEPLALWPGLFAQVDDGPAPALLEAAVLDHRSPTDLSHPQGGGEIV